MKTDEFIMMPIPASAYTAVCALLGGASTLAISGSNERPAPVLQPERQAEPDAPQTGGDAGSGEIDAHGHPWSADLHAATKGKTKDGLWRMKVGVSRPDPLPGFPVPTGTASGGAASEAGASASGAGAPAGEDDDEFAAFRAAAAKSDATDAAAAASAPARKWTDADLGALCNQAAVKLGDPAPVKAIIATFIPEGQVAHSRNIPEDKREAFAKEVEAKAGIEFAG